VERSKLSNVGQYYGGRGGGISLEFAVKLPKPVIYNNAFLSSNGYCMDIMNETKDYHKILM